jgi:hypothetical protein
MLGRYVEALGMPRNQAEQDLLGQILAQGAFALELAPYGADE